MKHLGLIIIAVLVAAIGVLILVVSKCATTPAIVAGAAFIVLALALAIPAQFKAACETVAPYVPLIRPPTGGAS
jgi:hypothetical protein